MSVMITTPIHGGFFHAIIPLKKGELNMNKPLTDYTESNVREFSRHIIDTIKDLEQTGTEKSALEHLVESIYKEGLKDGLLLAGWLSE